MHRLYWHHLSDTVHIFLHQALMVGGLPFEMRLSHDNAETEVASHEASLIAKGKISTKDSRFACI